MIILPIFMQCANLLVCQTFLFFQFFVCFSRQVINQEISVCIYLYRKNLHLIFFRILKLQSHIVIIIRMLIRIGTIFIFIIFFIPIGPVKHISLRIGSQIYQMLYFYIYILGLHTDTAITTITVTTILNASSTCCKHHCRHQKAKQYTKLFHTFLFSPSPYSVYTLKN